MYLAYSVEISSQNIWALSVMKKLPKKTIAQEAKIRPIWSPWPASHLDRKSGTQPVTRVARWYIFKTKNPILGKFWRVL
jgi:hypothetical protein